MQNPDPDAFVRAVKPLLERKDAPGLLALIRQNWNSSQIVSLLSCKHCDARKVAALSLGLVGESCCLDDLARQLKDPDAMVNQMAEHAMWSIWFRAGTPEANHQLCRGAEAAGRGDYEHAISHFDRALQFSPDFSEAFNQRALTLYLMERYTDAIVDCEQAVKRMPIHFGAWSGLGHCHAHLNQLSQAVCSYEKALSINPHMTKVREAVEQLQAKI